MDTQLLRVMQRKQAGLQTSFMNCRNRNMPVMNLKKHFAGACKNISASPHAASNVPRKQEVRAQNEIIFKLHAFELQSGEKDMDSCMFVVFEQEASQITGMSDAYFPLHNIDLFSQCYGLNKQISVC